jgi:hypothetical protein
MSHSRLVEFWHPMSRGISVSGCHIIALALRRGSICTYRVNDMSGLPTRYIMIPNAYIAQPVLSKYHRTSTMYQLKALVCATS